MNALLLTKFHVPPVRPALVPRPRLIERMNAGVYHRLTLISAPAGSGKTTLVAAWLSGAQRPYAWLSVDESDNDPVRFFTYFTAALQRVDPGIGQAARAMLQSPEPPPPESFLTSLVNDIATTSSPFILVLDDYHLIQMLPIHQQLAFLLDHAPPQMHLVIVTREDPLLPLSRLRARGQMSELRQADLKFTEEEAADFLQRVMQLSLSSADVSTLHRHTEGWIAGLQLAALSLRGRGGVGSLVQSFAGDQRYIIDYLFDEVFQQQSHDVQSFLLQTSILERLTAPLCDAVTGREDSREVLLALEHANLFLVPLDESRQWYRYHHLFHDLLRTQRNPSLLAPLHQKAAHWYKENGFLDEALGHALAAEDWDEAERLVAPACSEAIRNGQFATLGRWLAALPDALVRQRPGFATLKAWASLAMGQQETAEASADLAESLLPADAPSFDRGVLVALRTYISLARRDVARTIQLATDALALLDKGDPYFARGAVLNNLAQAQVWAGDIPAATQTYRELLRQSQGVHPLSAVSALSHLADCLDIQGQRNEAMVLCQQALAQCMDARGRPLPPGGLTHILLGGMCYEGNDLPSAQQHLLQGLELAKSLSRASVPVAGMIELARLQLANGEAKAALATIGEVRQLASQLHWPHVDSMVAAMEAEFALRQGDIVAVERWAESAGLSPTDWPSHVRESEYLTYARLLLAEHRLNEVQVLLANLERFAQEGGRGRDLITVWILQALAQLALGDRKQALARLEEAVRLAAPEGYVRAFLDEGQSILKLLPPVRHVAPAFVDALIIAFGTDLQGAREAAPERPDAHPPSLIEPLSDREMEVLRLVASGLSNGEIAGRLIITVGTVKTHVHNICGKLAVRSRTQAIARARELVLL